MRATFTFLILFIFNQLSAQSIQVNPTASEESDYDAETLTKEVLIDGGECSSIENFELKDNPSRPFPQADRSWGYFEKGDSEFPFEKGIILTTGYAKDAEGPDTGDIVSKGEYNWSGDSDANTLAENTTNNATIFEFDFIPYGNEISFNYIFASEEYPGFACSTYNDVFGFIISGPGITNDPGLSGKNIALLPNGDYVTINNVNDQYCGDDEFYVPGQYSNPFEDIEYGGRTVALTAYSEVQSGETYHIRLLIADAGDTSYDSAVFLEAGSFSLGGTLVDVGGAELGEDETLCDLDEYTLVVDLNAPEAIFQWSFNGDIIPGADDQQYTATETGTYSVLITSGSCSTEISVNLVFGDTPEAVDYSEFVCSPSGSYVFDLNNYEANISTTPDAIFEFHSTILGAESGNDGDLIPDAGNFEVNGTETVYVRVESVDGCFVVVNLELEVGIGPETQPAEYQLCDENGDGFAEFDLTTYTTQLVLSDPSDLVYEYYLDEDGTQLIPNPDQFTNTTNPEIVYVKIYNPSLGDQGCISFEELTLEVLEFPEIQSNELTICDNLNDNSEFVDLTINDMVVTEGIDVTLAYYPSLNDLNNSTNEIVDPSNFEVTNSNTEIFVQVKSDSNNCESYEIYTINMEESPETIDTFLEKCSLNDFASFILSDAEDLIIGNQTGVTVTYHLTFNDAFDNINPIDEEFENTIPNQIIYVRVENENGCFNIAELELTTISIHEILSTTLSVCDDPYAINDGFANFDLTEMNDEVQTALGGNDYDFTFHHTQEDARDGINPIDNPTNYQNTTSPETIYVRAVTSDGGCAGTAEFIIEVLEVPEFDLQIERVYCPDEIEKEYEFEGEYETYTWYDSAGNIISNASIVEFGNEGVYTLEVTEAGLSCPAKRDIEIIFEPAPSNISIDVNENTVTISHDGTFGPYEYSYNNGLTWHDDYILENVPGGIYTLLFRSVNGCISEGKIFGVLGIPNVITPNGDGFNDIWEIRGLEAYPDASIKIFDRYGKIFMDRKIGNDFKWDGTYLGSNVPSGDYWYIISVEGTKQLSGHITIKNQ